MTSTPAVRRLYQRRRDAGLCVRCGEKPTQRTACLPCRLRRSVWIKQYRRRLSVVVLALLSAHICGQGQVALSMTYPADCERVACAVEHPLPDIAPDAYRELCGNCFPGYGLWIVGAESWSDWPESPCWGHRL